MRSNPGAALQEQFLPRMPWVELLAQLGHWSFNRKPETRPENQSYVEGTRVHHRSTPPGAAECPSSRATSRPPWAVQVPLKVLSPGLEKSFQRESPAPVWTAFLWPAWLLWGCLRKAPTEGGSSCEVDLIRNGRDPSDGFSSSTSSPVRKKEDWGGQKCSGSR